MRSYLPVLWRKPPGQLMAKGWKTLLSLGSCPRPAGGAEVGVEEGGEAAVGAWVGSEEEAIEVDS